MASNTAQKTNYSALTTLTLVFFFWGFIAAGNSVFIPFCKSYFKLDQFQSQLIDFAFYGAYYLGALVLFVFGTVRGKDLVGTWGYKKSIVYGLLFSALGAGAMIVSVYNNVFSGMLLGLFIVALGFSLQQTSANPFMISLGDEATGSNRINLGGGINSFGTTMGPLIVSLALFGVASSIDDELIQSLSLNKVIILYTCVGLLFLGIALLFRFSKSVPDGKREEKQESAKSALVALLVMTGLLIACFSPVFSSYLSPEAKQIEANQETISSLKNEISTKLEATGVTEYELSDDTIIAQFPDQTAKITQLTSENSAIGKELDGPRMMWLAISFLVVLLGIGFSYFRGKSKKEGWGAMQYPQLTLGMFAIFMYVGVEVAIGSNLGELLKQPEFGGHSASELAPFVAMFWGSLMIGRWSGSINAFEMSNNTKQILRFVVPLVAFGVILASSSISGFDVQPLYWYIICVFIQIIAFYIANDKPTLTLAICGALGIVASMIGLMTSGMIAIYAFLSAGLFLSIMWPCIFSLSLAGTGKYQTQGAAFLVMMILGGAILPPIQGKLADVIGIQASFIVGVICFVYLTLFALIVRRILNQQGVNFD